MSYILTTELLTSISNTFITNLLTGESDLRLETVQFISGVTNYPVTPLVTGSLAGLANPITKQQFIVSGLEFQPTSLTGLVSMTDETVEDVVLKNSVEITKSLILQRLMLAYSRAILNGTVATVGFDGILNKGAPVGTATIAAGSLTPEALILAIDAAFAEKFKADLSIFVSNKAYLQMAANSLQSLVNCPIPIIPSQSIYESDSFHAVAICNSNWVQLASSPMLTNRYFAERNTSDIAYALRADVEAKIPTGVSVLKVNK